MFKNQELLNISDNLHKFALRLTRNRVNADDLLQMTLLRALEKKDLYQDGTNLFGWTSKIMYNLFVSGYRSKVKFESQYDPAPLINSMHVPPTQESICELHCVQDALQRLSHEHREILHLVCIQGMGYEEAAQSLDVPVGTIRSRLSRARKTLQSILHIENDTLLDYTPNIPAVPSSFHMQATA